MRRFFAHRCLMPASLALGVLLLSGCAQTAPSSQREPLGASGPERIGLGASSQAAEARQSAGQSSAAGSGGARPDDGTQAASSSGAMSGSSGQAANGQGGATVMGQGPEQTPEQTSVQSSASAEQQPQTSTAGPAEAGAIEPADPAGQGGVPNTQASSGQTELERGSQAQPGITDAASGVQTQSGLSGSSGGSQAQSWLSEASGSSQAQNGTLAVTGDSQAQKPSSDGASSALGDSQEHAGKTGTPSDSADPQTAAGTAAQSGPRGSSQAAEANAPSPVSPQSGQETASSDSGTARLPESVKPSAAGDDGSEASSPASSATAPPRDLASAVTQPSGKDKRGPTVIGFKDLYSSVSVRGMKLSDKLTELSGQKVEMTGFMAPPLSATVRFFVLTKVALTVCPFCSSDADWPADIVVVYMPDGKSAVPTEHQVKVTGTLSIGSQTDEETGFVSLIRIEADKVEVLK